VNIKKCTFDVKDYILLNYRRNIINMTKAELYVTDILRYCR